MEYLGVLHTGLLTPPASVTAGSPPTCFDECPLEKLWWNVNVPEDEWTVDCPVYMENQDEKNISILSTRQEDHGRASWAEVQHLVDTNRIDLFHRMPIDLRRYLEYCNDLRQRYGSVLSFMQHKRLNWPSVEPSGDPPFTNENDYKFLFNDWPYAIDQNVIHIVIWTKFFLDDDPETGELTTENRALVEDFVYRTFCTSSAGEAVIHRDDLRWFKNWRNLRSVEALEHFHVMVYKPPPELIRRLTNNDVPIMRVLEHTAPKQYH